MTPVIPCSASSISFFPGSAFTKSKNGCLTRFSSSRKSLKQTLCSQRVFLPLSVSVRVFPLYKFACAQRHTTRTHRLSATETDVVVEEQESPIADEDSSRPPEEPSSSIETNDDSSVKSDASITSAQTKRKRPSRKSEMPPVKNEDLIVGATFTGKVRSIQPFGAFVDFGAFTNGLVHVSRLSNSFVKDVSSVVSVGQEVKVKLVEVNMETGRISLSMRENDDKSKPQQRKEAVASSEKGRAPKRNPSRADQKKEEVKKSSKFVKGQDLVGTVKNLTRSGAFISLPEGEEGFLPSSEEADEGMGNLMGNSSLEVGQEVDVCVLRVTRGQVTLTMKKEEDFAELDSLLNQGPVYAATNPFVFAFRANKEIAAFLEEREKLEEEAQISTKPKIPEAADETKEQAETGSEIPNAQGHPVAGGKSIASVSTSLEDTVDSKDKSILAEKEASDMEDASEETPGSEDGKESSVSEISQSLDGAVEILGGEAEVKSEAVDAEGKVSTVDQIMDGASAKVELESDTMSVTAKVATDQISSTEKLADQEISVGQIVDHILNDTAKISSPETESLGDTKSDPSIDAADQVLPLAGAVSEEVVVTDQAQTGLEKDEAELPSSTESPDHTKSDLSIASVDGAASEEVSLTHQVEKDEAELPSSTDSSDYTKSDPSEDAVDKVASVDSESSEEVSLADQAKTGLEKDEAELPSSKESPDYTKYDLSEHAVDKFTSVDSAASEEVALTNQAETGLGKDAIGISISTAETGILAAFSTEDEARVDPISSSDSVVRKELATETQTEDATAKEEVQIQTSIPENGIPSASSAEGQLVASFTQKDETTASSNEESYEVSFQQSSVKDQLEIDGKADASGDEASGQLLSSQIQLSEEKAEDKADSNVNSEMPIQLPSAESENSSAKPIDNENGSSATTEDGNVTKSNGSTIVPSQDEISPKATISPALVKQLREETGSGMMDCKKALAETGGDIVKAQEYLRKKGLASAEKKASRVTAEGRISSYIHDSRIGVLIEVNCETDFVSRGEIFKELVDDLAMQVAACPQVDYLVTEDIPKELVDKEREIEMQKEDLLSKPEQIRAKIVDGRIRKRLEELALLEQPYIKNDKVLVKDWVKQTIATIGENIKVKRFVRYNLGEGLEKKSQDFAAEVAAQTAAKPSPVPVKELPASTDTPKPPEKTPTVTVSAALVKQLREETGAGMMDCKKALSETGGDLEKAQEYLRKKGLSTADKKSSRLAAEGRIGSYIHDSRIGVLIEVNCETDFVGRSENFKELVDDLAMQAVACPQVEFVSIDNIPETFVSKEKEIEMQREDILSKPETIREKIVEGRVSKRLGELALLEQPFIKDDSILVKDLVKQTVASLGENIKVRRFVRFALGEQTEDANAEPEA